MRGVAKQVCVAPEARMGRAPAAGDVKGLRPSACGLTPAYCQNNEGSVS